MKFEIPKDLTPMRHSFGNIWMNDSEFFALCHVLDVRYLDWYLRRSPSRLKTCPDSAILPPRILEEFLKAGIIEKADDFGNIKITDKFLEIREEYGEAVRRFHRLEV